MSRWRRPTVLLTLAVLSVLAVLSAAITVPALLHSDAPRPLAPGLAALGGDELAEFLPRPTDFPAGWEVQQIPKPSDVFGYHAGTQPDFTYHPPECFGLIAQAGGERDFAAVGVVANDPADYEIFSTGLGVRVAIIRDFHPALLDQHAALVARCAEFSEKGSDYVAHQTVTVLQRDQQHLRYALTRTVEGEPADTTQADYYSYARASNLLVVGHAGTAHQRVLDALFEETLQRINAR